MKKSLILLLCMNVLLLASCQSPSEQNKTTTLDTSIETSTTKQVTEQSQTSETTTAAPVTTQETTTETTTIVTTQETQNETTTEVVPPTSQRRKKILAVTPQIQEEWYFCAPATVSMILATQGKFVSQRQLAQEMGTYVPFGTHNKDAIRVLNQHLFGYSVPKEGQAGYRLASVTNASPNSEEMRLFKERVRKNIDDGYPMYYTFTLSKIYPGKNGEHNVIGIGYELTPDGKDISAIYYLDSMTHEQDPVYGGLKKVTPEELLEAMAACEEPNYAW